jgi:hypothetical protein
MYLEKLSMGTAGTRIIFFFFCKINTLARVFFVFHLFSLTIQKSTM